MRNSDGGDPVAMGDHPEVIDSLAGSTRDLRAAAPDAGAGFGALHNAAVAEGVLTALDENVYLDLNRDGAAPTEAEIFSSLAVFAHPDDESFGLGAVLGALVDAGIDVAGVCFTHGEASTLGAAGVDLHRLRAAELVEAAAALAIGDVELLDYPDGGLSDIPLGELAERVIDQARRHHADLLVAFDEGGITGHPDHQQATRAALAAGRRLGLPVLAWAVTDTVATALNAEFASTFVGRGPGELDLTLAVDRRRQLAAIRSEEH